MFLNFLSQKVTNFCSKKQKMKKKTKKNIPGNSLKKKNILEFLSQKSIFWVPDNCPPPPLVKTSNFSSKGGTNYQTNLGSQKFSAVSKRCFIVIF